MNARLTGALLALAAAGCGTSAANTVGARLQGPTAIVAFVGATAKNDGQLHDYFAIASSRGDELAILDPADEQPVRGPGAVFPLVVPTAPSPLLLASAPLGDATTAVATADLLVAVSAGGRSLQLVNTWDATANRIVADVDLSAGLQGGIVSLAAVTVPGATPPQARVIVGAAGRQLAVVTFQRAAAGVGIEALPFDPAADVRSLDFEPRSLAVEPAAVPPATTAPRLFVATPDPVVAAPTACSVAGTTCGVAQLTMEGAIASWPVAALDARAGTTLVAAARVRELDLTQGPGNAQGREIFASSEVLRVYAVLDAASCGPAGRIACGLATLDPATGGLAADPAATGAILDPAPPAVPPQSYRAPVQIPAGVIGGIAFAFPPARGTARVTNDANPGIPLLTTTSAARSRPTTAVAALTSSDGRTYLFDAGRFDFVEDAAPLGTITRLVTVAASISGGGGPLLGLHGDYPPVAGANVTGVSTAAGELPQLIVATPGFTPSDTWTVSYQGVLPGLVNVRGVLFESGGAVYVAAQSEEAVGTVVSVPVAAPELGVRPSPGHADRDTVTVTCPDGSAPQVPIEQVLPAGLAGSVAVPGGALQLPAGTCSVAPGGTLPVTFTVRAAAYVLVGVGLGYAGRPEIDKPFSLAWQEEDAAGLPPEDLALARKARRRHYVTEAPCIAVANGTVTPNRGCYTGLPGILDPLAPGPVLSFELGLSPASAEPPAPDTRITFTTQAGRTPVSRRPAAAGVLPQGITSFDPTRFPGRENEAVRFYATYADDQLLVFTPAGTAGQVKSIR